MEFTGKNAEKVWKKVLKHILENGNELVDNKNMPHKESLNIIAKIESMEGITKPIEILRGFEKWVYPNLEEIKDSILEKNPFNRYYYDYGLRAFNFNGVNQVDDYVVPLLKKSPNSRRAVVVFYTPSDGVPLKKETPGLITMAFNIRNKKLHATSVLRSNDFFLRMARKYYPNLCFSRLHSKKA